MSFKTALLRVLSVAAVLLATAIAFYGGGVAGFNDGFQTGYHLARIASGGQALSVLDARAEIESVLTKEQREGVESMIDQALMSHAVLQELGDSPFDVIGSRDDTRSERKLVEKIGLYRQSHPSLSWSPEFKSVIEDAVRRMQLPPTEPAQYEAGDAGIDASSSSPVASPDPG